MKMKKKMKEDKIEKRSITFHLAVLAEILFGKNVLNWNYSLKLLQMCILMFAKPL